MKNIVLVDIDGTIADCTHRLHHITGEHKDWDKFFNECDKDTPIEEMLQLIRVLLNSHYDCYFVTGRSEICRSETRGWLSYNIDFITRQGKYAISVDKLLMRREGDRRPDYIIKKELVEEAGIKLEDIAFVLEDRQSVVDMWRDNGVRVLQVAKGDF